MGGGLSSLGGMAGEGRVGLVARGVGGRGGSLERGVARGGRVDGVGRVRGAVGRGRRRRGGHIEEAAAAAAAAERVRRAGSLGRGRVHTLHYGLLVWVGQDAEAPCALQGV